MSQLDMIALDADDTLWHNEVLYTAAQKNFAQLLSKYHDEEWISERLYQTETQNLKHFGYGIKAFALSMIETAVELTEGRISGSEIKTLIDQAKEMINADVHLLDHTAEAVSALAEKYPLMVITKGDLLDQENKISRSGLEQYFSYIEIVSDKSLESYQRLLKKYSIRPENFLMVGNSLRSDILPILELGGSAVYIPYQTTWLHERAEVPSEQPGFFQLDHIGLLPGLVERIARGEE
jgi:putative hydrolase of the HAD superfamily